MLSEVMKSTVTVCELGLESVTLIIPFVVELFPSISEALLTESVGSATVVVAVEELFVPFGSDVVLATDATLVIVEPLAPELTCTTNVKVGDAAAAKLALVLVTVPVPPTGGVVDVHPAGAVNETKVVLAGTVSVTATFCASLGPPLVNIKV